MASQKITNGPSNGPKIPSQRPTILLNSPELSKSPYLDALKVLLDEVFDWAHVKAIPGKEFLPDKMGRLQSGPQQLVSEIGPNGFCIIMFEGKIGGKIIATASAKPYKPTKDGDSYGSEVNMMFKRVSAFNFYLYTFWAPNSWSFAAFPGFSDLFGELQCHSRLHLTLLTCHTTLKCVKSDGSDFGTIIGSGQRSHGRGSCWK